MDKTVLGRYVGNTLIIVGYFTLLHIDLLTGIYIRITANLLCMPWGIKYKVWDFVILLAFLITIEVSKLVTML